MAGILQRWLNKSLLKKYDRVSIPVTDLHDNADYQMGAFELGQVVASNPDIGTLDRIYGVATNLDEGGDYNIDNLKEPGRYTWTTKVPGGIAIEGRTTENNKYGSLTVTKVGSGNDRKQVLNFGIDNTQYSRTNPGGNNPWGVFKEIVTDVKLKDGSVTTVSNTATNVNKEPILTRKTIFPKITDNELIDFCRYLDCDTSKKVYIAIKMPYVAGQMFMFTVSVYDYAGGYPIIFEISGYTVNNALYNAMAIQIGGKESLEVSFYLEQTEGEQKPNLYIYIGNEGGRSWTFSQFYLTNMKVGFSGRDPLQTYKDIKLTYETEKKGVYQTKSTKWVATTRGYVEQIKGIERLGESINMIYQHGDKVEGKYNYFPEPIRFINEPSGATEIQNIIYYKCKDGTNALVIDKNNKIFIGTIANDNILRQWQELAFIAPKQLQTYNKGITE